MTLVALAALGWLLTPVVTEYGIHLPWGPEPGPAFELVMSSPSTGQGEMVGLRLKPNTRFRRIEKAVVSFSGLRLVEEVEFVPMGPEHVALVPVSYAAETKGYPYQITILDHRGKSHTLEGVLTVEEREFEIQRIKMGAQQMSLMTSTNLDSDRAKVAAAKADPTPAPLWSGPFVRPLEGRISTEFGVTRYVNGVLYSRHSGIDIAAPEGTPVVASNSGLVVLADTLIASGKSVIIDHGLGLYSAYNHLSRLDVQVGDQVQQGQQIAAVGTTGFSTGPHLHYTLSVGAVATNPWPWFERDPMELLGAGTGP